LTYSGKLRYALIVCRHSPFCTRISAQLESQLAKSNKLKRLVELEKLSSIKDRGQTDRVTTFIRDGLYRWPWPLHAARSWWRNNKNVLLRPSISRYPNP